MYLRTLLRLVATGGLLFAAKSARGGDDPMSCVKELAMPSLRGHIHVVPITITAHIRIGAGGIAKNVTYVGATPGIKFELDEYFKGQTRYLEACNGKTISFTIRYLVEGQKTGHPVWEVRFKPPDEIIVITNPMDAGIDPSRIAPPTSN